MSTTTIVRVCVLAIALSVSGCGRLSGSKGLGFPTRHRSDALPTIRLVPEMPPRGEAPYPCGTKIDKHAGVIYFPPNGGPTKIWFSIMISGWGREGLAGYEAHVLRRAICPIPPCNCEPEPWITPCQANTDCVDGSDCVGGDCEEVFVQTRRKNYVFECMPHDHSAESTPTGYRFAARLHPGVRPRRDRGKSVYAGSFVYFTNDLCPMLDQWNIVFDPGVQNRVLLGDGNEVKPLVGGVTVVQEKAE